MASAVKYLSNVTKSIKYATVDALKELNPVIVEGVEENKDVAKVTYSTIKNFKTIVPKAARSLADSQVGELAKEAKRNIIEDLKSGKFYNRERQERGVDQAIMNSGMGFDSDYRDFMVDEDSDDLGFDTDSNEFLADNMDKVGEKTSNAVNQVLVRTAEYQVEATRQSTTRMLAQTSAMTATLHGDLAAVNANIAGVVKFNQEAMTTHIENSRMFYERQQQQMSEQISLLTEIRDIQKAVFTPKSKSLSSKVGVSDLFTSNGMLNLAEYFKYVQQNAKEQDSGIGDMLSMVMDLGMGKAAVANPLGTVMTMGIKAAIPKMLKDAMEEFNETLAGSVSTALVNLTKKKDSMDSISSLLGNIFGLDLSVKKGINTGAYEKGATAWTGKDHKALTEVIPTLLSKIYSSVSGSGEIRYDYESGRFKSAKQIKKDYRNMKDKYVRSANDTVLPYIQDELKKVNFKGDKKREQELIDNLERILRYNFENMEKFNPKDKSKSAKTYGLKGDHAEYDLELIRSIYEKIPKSKQLKNQNDLINSVLDLNKRLTEMQESGDSEFNILFDGSMGKKGKKTTTSSPIAAGFSKLDTTNSLLSDIRNYLYEDPKKRNKRKVGKNVTTNNTQNVKVVSKSEKKKEDKVKSTFGFNIYRNEKDTTMNIDDDINLDKSSINTEESKFISDIKKADTATQKLKALFKGGSLLITQPAKFATGILKKVDNRLYDLLFSDDEDDTDSVMGRLKEGFDDWFETLKETTKNKIDGIKEAIDESDIKGKFSSIMKNLFGFDFSEWEGEFKEALFGDKDTSLVSGLKDLFGKGFREIFDGFRNFFKTETPKETAIRESNRAAKDIIKALGKTKTETVPNAASGMKKVTKTGIVAVSEGEMIIPPDMNIENIKKRSKKEKKAIEDFESVYGPLGVEGYAEGGTTGYGGNKSARRILQFLKNKIKEGWTESQVREYVEQKIDDVNLKEKIIQFATDETVQYAKNRAKKVANKAINFGSAVGEEAKNFVNDARENVDIDELVTKISGVFNKNIPEGGRDVVNDVMSNFKQYLPRVAASGALGMGLSVMLGLAGGPILGGAVGAGLGLLSKSEKLQTWLFGKELEDGSGRDGTGVISKNITQNINKYFPNMAKGAIVGGITSILPFVPGGPMAGILVGSAIGFARSNDKLKNQLFGEDSKLTKIVDTVKQKLPKMGLGAAVGMLAGPFGLTTNLMLGAGLGFVSDTEKFKEIVFGTKGFDGKRAGGLVGFIRDAAEIPINGIKDLFNQARTWFKDEVLAPIRKGLNPFIQQIKNIGLWIKDGITSAFSEHVAKPVGAFLNERIIQPVEKALGGIINTILKPIKFIASTPFKLFGAAGQALERRQLRRTGAAAGTAVERIAKREDLDKGRKRARYTNTEANTVDSVLVSATDEELSDYKLLADYAQDTASIKGRTAKGREKALTKFSKGVIARGGLDKQLLSHVNRKPRQLDRKDYEYIMDQVAIGNYKGPVALILQSPVFPEEYKKQTAQAIKDTALKVRDAREKAANFTKTARDIKNRTGVDVTDKNFQRVVNQEYKGRGLDNPDQGKDPAEEAGDKVSETIKDTHSEAMDALNRIANAIEIMAYPDKKREYYKNKSADQKKQKELEADQKRRENQLKKGKLIFDGEDVLDNQNITDENIEEFASQDIKKKPKSKFSKLLNEAKSKLKNVYNEDIAWRIDYAKNVTKETPGNIRKKAQDASDTVRTSISDVIFAAQAGDYSTAMRIANGELSAPGKVAAAARGLVNKIRNTANKAKTVMTEAGPILMRKDKNGNDIPDQRDSETKQTLENQEEQRQTQKGILSKITSLGDGIKGLFGFSQDEEDEEGFFSKIAKYALPILAGVGGIAGVGLLSKISKKKIQVQQKDAQGNKMYDENGNPIMTETTIGDAIKDKVTEVWLGPDGTGNTSGVWYHVKDFTRNTVLPLIGEGIDLIADKLPDLIQLGVKTVVENAPQLFGTVFTGIASGVVSLFKDALSHLPVIGGFFKDKDKKDSDKQSSESIEGGKVTLTTGTTGAAQTTSGVSGSATKVKEGSTAAKLQSIFDKYNGPLKGSSSTNTVASTTASNTITTSGSATQTSNVSTQTTSVGSSAVSGTANIVEYTNSTAGEGSEKDITQSLAYQRACPSVQKKALSALKQLWNTPVLDGGITVAQLCNDDETVIAEVTGSDGNVVQLTGADLLLYPDLASQVIGADISLTDEERDENSQYVRGAVDTNPGNWAAVKILATGGKYGKGTLAKGTKIITGVGKFANKFGSGVAKVTKHIPILNRVGKVANITGKAFNMSTQIASTPMRLMEGGRKIVEDYSDARKAGWGVKHAADFAGQNVRYRAGQKINKAQDAFNDALESRKVNRLNKVNEAEGSIKKTWQKAKNAVADKVDDTVGKVGNKAFDTAGKATTVGASDVKKATSGMKNAFNAVKNKGGKVGKAAEKVGEVAGKVKDKAGKLSGKASEVVSNITKLLDKFLSDSKVLKQLEKVLKCAKKKVSSEAISKALKEFAEKIVTKFEKGIAKAAAKVISKISAKLAAYIGSAGIVAAAFLVVDFVSGLSKADAIMGVEKPTVAERLIAGLVNAFAETFFITLVVDTKDLVQFCIGMLENLGVDFSDLRERQAEAEKNCEEYNREHGTNYTVEEYLMSDHLSTKIKNALGKAWDTVKGAGKKAWNGIKGAGKAAWNFITGKSDDDDKEIEKKEKEETTNTKGADSNTTGTAAKVTAAAAETTTSSDQLFYDNEGNVVGSGLNENGVMEQSFVPQGEFVDTSSDTTGDVAQYKQANGANLTQEQYNAQVGGNVTGSANISTGTLISPQNNTMLQKSTVILNQMIPNLINNMKTRIGAMFGLKPSEMNKTSNVGANAYRTSPATMFFNSITNMWTNASKKMGNMASTLPKTIGSAAKNASHFLAVAFGLADPSEKNVSLDDATKDTYINRRAETIKETSAFSATLAGASVTGSNSADATTQSTALDNKKTSQSSSSLMSKVGNFVSKIFGFGGGSGSGVSGDKDGIVETLGKDKKAETFVSQKYSKYAKNTFTVKGDEKRQTVSDAGCAPAAATMAINNLGTVQPLNMDTAIKHAIEFKKPNGGVTADYFLDEFRRQGLTAAYVAGNDQKKESIIMNQLRAGNPIILMGQDENNSTKKVSPFGPKTHYVVATGLSPDGRTIYINDPEARSPRVPYSVNRVMKGTILGVAPVANSRSRRVSSSVDKKAKNLLSRFSGGDSYGEDTVQYKVWNGLRSGGYSEYTVAATMGNIEAECSFNPDLIEKGSGAGYGLVQWTGGRRTKYENYAKSKGKDRSDLPTQIEYLLKELAEDSGIWTKASSSYGFGSLSRADWANANGTGDIEKATKAFMCCFERPSYDSSINHIDRRIEAAKKYFEAFTGTPVSGSNTTEEGGETSESNNPVTEILNFFSDLGAAYGLTDGDVSGSSESTTSSSGGANGPIDEDVHGNVSSNPEFAKKQKQMANMMKQYEGQIQYSWGPGTKYDGPTRDPSQEINGKRYGDCSSTVQWVYKSVLGADPGPNTYSQETDSDTYTVGKGTSDESKLQLGDLLLKNGHVEMYYGDGRMIGHGGGSNGKTPGPTIKDLGSNPPYTIARRWVGFKGGSGSGLTSYTPQSKTAITGSKSNKLYRRKWTVGGSGSGITNTTNNDIDTSAYELATTTSTATPASRGSSRMVSAKSKASSDNMDKLIQIIIGLLSQVVNNTSAIKDISTLLIKLIDLKSSSSGLSDSEKNAIGNEMGMMKALIAQSFESQTGSEDQNLIRLIQNVEAIAQQ